MGAWFSSKPKAAPKQPRPVPTAVDSAQLKLRVTRDRTDKFAGRLRGECDSLTRKAKEALSAGRKDQATYLLKLRKIKTSQLDKATAQLINLEQMVQTIESEAQNQAFVQAVAQGNAALQAMQEQMPIEKARQIMEDSEDAMAYQQEIDEAFASTLGEAGGPSEAELMAELDSMVAAAAAAEASRVVPAPAVAAKPVAAAPAQPVAAAPAPAADVVPPAIDILSQLPEVPTALPARPIEAPLQASAEALPA